MTENNNRLRTLQSMMQLEERRATLQAQLDDILGRLRTLGNDLFQESNGSNAPREAQSSTPSSLPRKAGRPPKAGKAPRAAKSTGNARGALKEKIYAALKAAGDGGVLVKELAKALGTNPVNIHSWFHSNSKKHPQIKKIKGGHYKLTGSLPGDDAPKAQASAPAPEPGAAPRRGRGRPPGSGKKSTAATTPKAQKVGATTGKRGALSANILAELGKVGGDGIHLKDLADRIGTGYRNVAIWFATTGKKHSNVKKAGPARYRLSGN